MKNKGDRNWDKRIQIQRKIMQQLKFIPNIK